MNDKSAYVGDVLQLQRRRVQVDASSRYREIGVRSFGRGLFVKDEIRGADIGAKRVFRIESADLVVSNIFAWEGAVAVADGRHDGLIGSHRFMTWTPIDPRVDVEFLHQFFLSDRGLELLQSASPGSAGRNRTLSISAFQDLEIPTPSLQTQRKNVELIKRCQMVANQRVQSSRRVIDLKTLLRERIFNQLDPANRVRLSDLLLEDESKTQVEIEGTYPNLGVLNRGRGLFSKPPLVGGVSAATTLYPIRVGQVLYSRLFAWEGSVAMVPPEYDGWFVSNEFPHFFVDDDLVDPGFLAAALQSNDFMEQIAVAGRGLGQRRKRVNVEAFLSLRIPLPDLDQQRGISERISEMAAITQRASRLTDLAEALPKAARNEIFLAI